VKQNDRSLLPLTVASSLLVSVIITVTSFGNSLYSQAWRMAYAQVQNQFGDFGKPLEYTVVLDGKEIFPNDMVKQNIVTNYESSHYNINSLKYSLLGFDISALDIKIHVIPSKIDTARTKLDFPVIFARNVAVSNGFINLRYGEINLGSIYGIYDKTTDKITMHIPINIALQYLPHNLLQ
jgi:hypothetical protein